MTEQEFPFPVLVPEPSSGLICQECLRDFEAKDLESRNDRGMMLLLCGQCRQALDERRQIEIQAAKDQRAFQQDVVRVLVGRNASVPTITETVAMLIEKFGGRQPFVDKIFLQIEAMFKDRPGSPAAISTCKMLLGMVLASTAYQHSLPPAAELSDEEVVSELQKMIEKLKAKTGDAVSSDSV